MMQFCKDNYFGFCKNDKIKEHTLKYTDLTNFCKTCQYKEVGLNCLNCNAQTLIGFFKDEHCKDCKDFSKFKEYSKPKKNPIGIKFGKMNF